MRSSLSLLAWPHALFGRLQSWALGKIIFRRLQTAAPGSCGPSSAEFADSCGCLLVSSVGVVGAVPVTAPS